MSESEFGNRNDERLAATTCVIGVLVRAYARQSSFFGDATERALAALERRTGKPVPHFHELAAAICEQLKEKWKQEHIEFEGARRAELSATMQARLSKAREMGLPVQRYCREYYVRDDNGAWVRLIDEKPASGEVAKQIDLLCRHRSGGGR